MKTGNISKLEEAAKKVGQDNVLTKTITDAELKKKKTIQRSYSVTEYHHEYLIKKMSQEINKTKKNISVSKILRDIIENDMKRNSK